MTENLWYHRLKAARKGRGWSQEKLAAELNLEDFGTVSRWERGLHIPGEDSQRRLNELFPDVDFAFPPPRSQEPIWDFPYDPNPFFTGREAVLDALHQRLTEGRSAALTQSIRGLGGIGKTQTAAEYAYRYCDEYDTILWLRATPEHFASDVLRIATLLRLPAAKKPQEPSQLVRAIVHWLLQHSRWLLVLDNVQEEIALGELLAAAGSGHILLTTRVKTIADLVSPLELHEMPPEDGALLLLRRAKIIPSDATLDATPDLDRTTAMELSHLMGGLPLALELAGAYIAENLYPLARYRAEYEQRRAELLAYRSPLHHRYTNYSESVATTWSLSFQRVRAQSPVSMILLRFCAFLSPDTIPEDLFLRGAPSISPLLRLLANSIEALNQALIPLLNYSLLRRNATERWVSVHRLVQAVIQDSMDDAVRRQWEERAVATLAAAFDPEAYGPLHEYELYVPHVLIGTEYIARRRFTDGHAITLLTAAGSYWRQHAWYAQAEAWCQQALALAERALGATHPGIVSKLTYLAQVYEDQRRHDQSEPLFQRGLTIVKQAYPPSHPDRARLLVALARCYWFRGKLPEAEPLFKEALLLLERALGPDHLDVANALAWLATVYREWDRFEEAEPLYRRALAIRERQLEPGHPTIAFTLDSFAACYLLQDQLAPALDMRQKALAMLEHAFGPEHPEVASCLTGLADTYTKLAVLVHLRKQGVEESEQALAGLSSLSSVRDYLKQAEQCNQRAIAIYEQVFGPDYAETGQPLCGLAIIAQFRGHFEQAEALYQHAMAVVEGSQGPEHPNLLGILKNYAHLLRILKRADEAAVLEKRYAAIERTFHGRGDTRIS